jgi:hypothetical protein
MQANKRGTREAKGAKTTRRNMAVDRSPTQCFFKAIIAKRSPFTANTGTSRCMKNLWRSHSGGFRRIRQAGHTHPDLSRMKRALGDLSSKAASP